MRNNIEKYRRMEGVTQEDFQDREIGNEKHWVRMLPAEMNVDVTCADLSSAVTPDTARI